MLERARSRKVRVPGGADSNRLRTAPVMALLSKVSSARSGSTAPRSTPMLPDKWASAASVLNPSKYSAALALASVSVPPTTGDSP